MALGGWQFQVMPAQINEDLLPAESPHVYVLRMAEHKARAVSNQVPPGSLVIGADTTVVSPQGDILAKPLDHQEALAMLGCLRGRTHEVLTALTVISLGDGRVNQDVCVTEVEMRPYSEAEILDYIATGDPFDKAGGYAIQHQEFDPVQGIKGCYANVVGLPVCTLARLLEMFGIETPNKLRILSSNFEYEGCPICMELTNNHRWNPKNKETYEKKYMADLDPAGFHQWMPIWWG